LYALVTGASSGIGKAIAEELAKKKIDLIISARRIPELEALKTDLESKYGIKVAIVSADLSIEKECRSLFEECHKFHPEIVVNNAGFGVIGMFSDNDLENELNMIKLNVVGLHILTKLFVASMDEGVILNVSSMAAFLPTPYMAAYAASKAYVYSLSEAINFEVKKSEKKLRVLTLCPGPIDTNFAYAAGSKPGIKGMSAKKCARIAVRGIMKKRHLIIPGFGMRLTKFLLRFFPLWLVLPTAFLIQKKKQ